MTHQPRRHGPGAAALLFGALCCALLISPLSAFAGGVGNDVCAGCHEEASENFHLTAHGVYFNSRPAFAEYGCESCHGSGVEHVADPSAENILNPARSDQFGSTLLCLQCHKGEQFDEWELSDHNGADVNCASCHTAHTPYTEAQPAASADLCYGCHTDVKAASMMPSRHPIGEGKLDCTDCHNPHGGTALFAQDFTHRELCFSCHADKEGPFVYEHAPVNEDCLYCHTPHGSVANNLLKQNEPALCLNCHAMHFHATVEGMDGPFGDFNAPERAGVSSPDGFKQAMLTKCTQCHTEVHGTDHPSQSISDGGNALTR